MIRDPVWLTHGDHPFLAQPRIREAWRFLRAADEWVVERQKELTAIPAPPFEEGARGRRMVQLLQEVGLTEVAMDQEGNVVGRLDPQDPPAPTPAPLILSAHLDTIFPAGTDVTPQENGSRIEAPGICDDGRGLAALLGLARVMTETPVSARRPVLFLASVGEEGPGNLRGVRHFFSSRRWNPDPAGFISLDGVGMDRIIHRAVGSYRFRITARGSGGHSWTDFGRPNPIHFLGRIVARYQDLALDGDERSTLTVARWGGGTSINAIPEEAWVEVDVRSEGDETLARLEEQLAAILREEGSRQGALGSVGEARRDEPITTEVQELGRRPSGVTAPSTPLVRAAVQATRIVGGNPRLLESSTDANIPMALGIPAITMGAGGTGGGIHTVREWYQNEEGPEGIFRALLTVLLLGSRRRSLHRGPESLSCEPPSGQGR